MRRESSDPKSKIQNPKLPRACSLDPHRGQAPPFWCRHSFACPKRAGQATLEYFILFAVIALATVIGLGTTFHTDIKTSVQDMVGVAAQKIAGPDGNTGGWPGDGGGDDGGGDDNPPVEEPPL